MRDPIPTGRTWRSSAAAVASVLVHAGIAVLLTGAALTIAAEVLPPKGVAVDVQMSVAPQGDARLLSTVQPPPAIPLDPMLAKSGPAKAGGSGINTAPTTGNSDLAQVLAAADAAATASGVATTSESGAAAALERTPTGAGVAFAGLTARGEQARTVVYVIDASGPMISSLSDVLAEVDRSVSALLPTQRFGVVLFRDNENDDGGVVLFDARLREANTRNRDELRKWLSGITAGGRSNPMAGLRAALALKPQVVFLLSRSINRTGGGVWDLGPAATLAELDKLNPEALASDGTKGRTTLVKTIQFQEPDPTGVMQQIAQRHGGKSTEGPAYRLLKREELQKR
ncbi:MAG: hypothetical protein QM783_00300 [Phycisphaerales bacterium]